MSSATESSVAWRRTRTFSFYGGNQFSSPTSTQQYNLRNAGHRTPFSPPRSKSGGSGDSLSRSCRSSFLRGQSPLPAGARPRLPPAPALRRLMAFVPASHSCRLAAQQAVLWSTNTRLVGDSTLLSYTQPCSAVSSKNWGETQAINFEDL